MRELFERIEDSKDKFDTYIELSMVEIYNENIRDLLHDDFPSSPTGGLKLLENEKERVRIANVTLRRPQSVTEVMQLVMLGNQRRSTSATESNSVSSRSHAVLQINVGRNSHGHEVDDAQELVRQCVSSATLSIIDLAGSERAAATRNMGARMKEGANINKSLLALSSCISALCQASVRGVKPHVPYRNSKLTRMLKFSLGGNCRTVMIVCVSPSSKDIEDTHNTLAWADKAKNVSTKISRNTAGINVSVAQYLSTISEKEQQIRILEAKLLEGPPEMSAYQQKKVEQARADARQALSHLRSELDGSIPLVQEGATLRALWDGAELRIASLKRRIEAIDNDCGDRSAEEIKREKQYIQSLIHKQDSAYRLNNEVQAAVQREAIKAEGAAKLLKRVEERAFGNALEAPELDNVRLKVSLQRDQLARSIADAREMAYRRVIQQQSEDSARAAALLHRMATSVLAEVNVLYDQAQTAAEGDAFEPSIARLMTIAASSESGLNSIFGISSSSASPLPSLPVSQTADIHPKLGNPFRRQSSISVNPPSLRTAPHTRRVSVAAKAIASPRRLARVAASPRKQPLRPILVTARDPGQSRRPLQWRDEAGKGDIDDSAVAPAAHVFTSSSSSSSLSPQLNGSSDASGEWDDEPDEPAQPVKGNMLPPSLPTTTLAGPPLPLPAPTNSIAPPMPAWKKNRIILGKTSSILGTLGEENAEQSSPEAGPSQPKLGSMGPPARMNRGPLLERHQLPSSTSTSFPSSSSSLFKPTAASAARAASIFPSTTAPSQPSSSPSRRTSSIGRVPITTSKASRRASNVGPYRRGRNSILPQPTGSTSTTDTTCSSASLAGPIFPLGGGVRRIAQDVAVSISPKDSSRRTSNIGAVSGMPRPAFAPRPSVSMNFNPGTLPRAPLGAGGGMPTLHSRPSISRFNTFGSVAGLAGAGDTSSRAVWR